jgi:perosamine synthetase
MDSAQRQIPVCSPQLTQRDVDYVSEALCAGAISGTGGKFLDRFENEFAAYCSCNHGIATSNGTTALHLALASLGIGAGDEVLVSTLTNMATFFAVLYLGATPVPVDIEPDTWNIDPALLGGLLTQRTKAILVVHLYGHPADMDPILNFARSHNLYVIEDAAEAHGALYKDRKTGSLSDIACFSFYANKIITTGEGGMLTTNHSSLAKRARSLRNLAYGPKERFMHSDIGFNYRLTNLQAALGCAQLERIDTLIGNKRRVARRYTEELSTLAEIKLPVEKAYAKNVYWMYHIVLKTSERGYRDIVMNSLLDLGIETRPAFVPYNRQDRFISMGMTRADLCPVANTISDGGFYLPSSPDLTEEDIVHVASSLRHVIGSL